MEKLLFHDTALWTIKVRCMNKKRSGGSRGWGCQRHTWTGQQCYRPFYFKKEPSTRLSFVCLFSLLFAAVEWLRMIKLRESQVYPGQRFYGHLLWPDCVKALVY